MNVIEDFEANNEGKLHKKDDGVRDRVCVNNDYMESCNERIN